MNRIIKFRGKRIDNGQWVYGFLAEDYYINDVNSEDFPSIEIAPETVGQFTGLLDKNGREIYEADIVVSKYSNPGEVVFSDGQFCVNYNGYCALIPSDAYETIGNIHDNPELLNSKQ